MNTKALRLAGGLLVGALVSCHHAVTGNASAAFVHQPEAEAPIQDASGPKLAAPTDVFIDAQPIEPLVLPAYPALALKHRAGTVTVRVDLTISSKGEVIEVVPDPIDLSRLSPFRQDFLDAIRTVVQSWRFEAAAVEHLTPWPNGQPVVASLTPKKSSYVVDFRFSESSDVSRSFAGH